MAFLTSPDPQLLTFKMFKVVANDPDGDDEYWAGTACAIEPSRFVTKSGSNGIGVKSVTVKVSFVTRDSWVLKEHTSNAYLLEHERLHYIIAICVGRKFYDDLLAITKPTSGELQSALNEMLAATSSLLETIGHRYDVETRGSRDKNQQAIWAQRVRGWYTSKRLTW